MSGKKYVIIGLLWAAGVWSAAANGMVLTNGGSLTPGIFPLRVHGGGGMVFSLQISRDGQEWRTIDFTNSESGDVVFTDTVEASRFSNCLYRIEQDPVAVSVTYTNYHGWTNCIVLRNGQAEVDIVPEIGRIMQFRLSSQADGPLWENNRMYGREPSADAWNTWGSFGGDKVWPSPQTVWGWPPPRAFDSMPDTAVVTNGTVILTSAVDLASGMRVMRRINLHPVEPVMRVSSTFEKLNGCAGDYGVWVVTQVRPTQHLYMPIPEGSMFPDGYIDQIQPQAEVTRMKNMLMFGWNPEASCKIANDGDALLWVGGKCELLIECPRQAGVTYPDNGCHASLYNNPRPVPYIEMEFLGPLARLGVSGTTEMTMLYSLFPRSARTALDEANWLMGSTAMETGAK